MVKPTAPFDIVVAQVLDLLRGDTDTEQVLSITVVASTIGVHENTLRNYERWQLVVPGRLGRLVRYSQADMARARVLYYLMNELQFSAEGARIVLRLVEDAQGREAKLRAANRQLAQRVHDLESDLDTARQAPPRGR